MSPGWQFRKLQISLITFIAISSFFDNFARVAVEIFIKALLCGASGIVIAHNHPSGDTTPSKEDIESYNRLKEAGKLIGINVLDSVIVGDSYYSFMENGI